MFDIGWTELLLVATVAIIVVGPKDLPRMLRTFGQTVGKLRRMAGDFQSTFNDAVRDVEKQADIDEMRKAADEAGNFDPLRDIKKSLDPLKNMDAEVKRDIEKPVTADTKPAAAVKKRATAKKPAAPKKAAAAKKASGTKKPATPKAPAGKSAAPKPAATRSTAKKPTAKKPASTKPVSTRSKTATDGAGDGKA